MAIGDIADALKRMIESLRIPISVSVRRDWSPQAAAAELRDQPVIFVRPASTGVAVRTRGREWREHVIEVGAWKKLSGQDERAEVDGLAAVLDAIQRAMVPGCVRHDVDAVCSRATIETLADDAFLRDHRIYAGIVSCRFVETA